jgi:DNA-binding NtrC family response regulator
MREGFEVEMASNGREALDFVRRGYPLDLVITDIRMPEMDGLALLGHVRHLRKGLPVIVMTGDPTPNNQLRAREKGASGFIAKPFSLEVLQRVVHESLKRAC